MRTLGELVDRLCTTNVRLWHLQDRVHEAARQGLGLDPETVRALADSNQERNHLMSEIDACFARGLASGKTKVEQRHKM